MANVQVDDSDKTPDSAVEGVTEPTELVTKSAKYGTQSSDAAQISPETL